MPLSSDAPRAVSLKAADRVDRMFYKTHKYLLELEREGWKCCNGYCLRDVDKRAVLARSALWAAKEVAQRRRDILNLVAWCRVYAQGTDECYELRLFGKPMCAKAFACAHGERLRTFSRMMPAVDAAVHGRVPDKVAFRKRSRQGKRRDDCAGWLATTLAAMAQPLPNKTIRGPGGEERTREFLPSGVFSTLNDVYVYYCGFVLADCQDEGVETRPASYQTFRRAWLANYFQVCTPGDPER